MVGTLGPAFHDREMSRRTATERRELETRIGYEFADKSSLERALTHISALSGKSRASSYQRLEFLGDHVLGLIVSDMLFRAFPKADEGELSRRLADLVRKEACADVAREIDLGAAIRLGASEANAGGRQRMAILADVCEALIGAVFLDGGYAAAAGMVERLWGERLRTPARPLRDPKTVLQEWAQARGLPTPSYKEISRTGPHHDPEFLVAVNLPEFTPAEGMGRSKRAAEQAAAAAMLSREGVQDDVMQSAAQESVKESNKESAKEGLKEAAKVRGRNRGAKDAGAKEEPKDGIDGSGVGDSVKAAAAG
jgi:ribonuclease III